MSKHTKKKVYTPWTSIGQKQKQKQKNHKSFVTLQTKMSKIVIKWLKRLTEPEKSCKKKENRKTEAVHSNSSYILNDKSASKIYWLYDMVAILQISGTCYKPRQTELKALCVVEKDILPKICHDIRQVTRQSDSHTLIEVCTGIRHR